MKFGIGGAYRAFLFPVALTAALVMAAGPVAANGAKRDPRTIRIVNNTTGPIQVMIDPFGRGTIAAGKTGGLSDLTGVLAWINMERKVKAAEAEGRPAPSVKITVRAMMARHYACVERVDYFTSFGMTIIASQSGGREGRITCEVKPGPRFTPRSG